MTTQWQQITWAGRSGRQYSFMVYRANDVIPSTSGVYVIGEETTDPNIWNLIYVGETGDFRDRLAVNWSNHHARVCIEGHNPTHVHLHYPVLNAQARRDIEADLLANWNFFCNG